MSLRPFTAGSLGGAASALVVGAILAMTRGEEKTSDTHVAGEAAVESVSQEKPQGTAQALEARLRNVEREVRFLKFDRGARTSVDASRFEGDDTKSDGSSVPEQVENALERERQETLERRIVLRQMTDLDVLEEFARGSTLDSAKMPDLQDVLFSATEQITQLIEEGTSARRSWPEIRADMDAVTASSIKELRGLLSDEEFERFAKISTFHGTALIIPTSAAAVEPSSAQVAMEVEP